MIQPLIEYSVRFAALSMAQASGLEGRLRAILQPKRRQIMLTRKTVTVAVAATLAIIAPLAAMRPGTESVMASAVIARAPAVSATRARQEAVGNPIQEKRAFVNTVHDYHKRVVHVFTDLAESQGQYAQAINQNRPDKIGDLLAPGYRLNGRATTVEQAVATLRMQIHRYGNGYYYQEKDAQFGERPVPFVKVTTTGVEYWRHGGRRVLGRPVSSRRDEWIMTPHGLKLLATETQSLPNAKGK